MKKLLLVMALLWGGGAFGVWVWSDARAQRITYRTVTVRRGDVRNHRQRHGNHRARGGC